MTLCKKYTRAKTGVQTSRDEFERLTNSADPANVRDWTMQAKKADTDRLHRVEAMDIYNAKTHTRRHQLGIGRLR
jgi:hypothetical protein